MFPILENWSIEYNDNNPYQAPETIVSRLIGNIYNDSRFDAGKRVITSAIQEMKLVEGTIRTRNTTYKLGKINPDYYNYCVSTKSSMLELLEKYR